ncbi:polymorphic toxin type 15 domain-containing protein [Nocardia altamirensis]|uniref:polymorphic toxin type 15 domain-containing protein n=1 Tax=Nocardia altamirensis TaxID=472158 RepID=UPI00114D12DE|nr:polymorphic toxin type 15 domain-containing protein [Nocardia altamirensis]
MATDTVRPTAESFPQWVPARASNLSAMSNNGLASEYSDRADAQRGGRVHNFHGMTPNSSARMVDRLFVRMDLTAGSDEMRRAAGVADSLAVDYAEPVPQAQPISDPVPGIPPTAPVVLPRAKEIVDPQAFTPMDEFGNRPPQPDTVPNPNNTALAPGPAQAAPPQNGPATAPPTVPVAPAQQAPPAQPAQPAATPDPDIFGLPDTTGRQPGDEWDSTLPDGRIVHNRIPFGNGNQTVDQTIPDGKGGFTQSRVAGNGAGGWQRWNVNADGTAFYGSKDDRESGMYAQDFDAGSSTSGAPDRVHVATPDYKGIQNPSFDADGNLVGVDIAVPNKYGMYDNYHYDNYNNLTISSARPDGKGGIESIFIGQLDSNNEGWQLGPDGKRWEVGKDLHGRTTMGRTEQLVTGTHIYFVDHRGVLFDTFNGIGSEKSYTDTYDDKNAFVRKYRDGVVVNYDPNGKPLSVQLPPDRRDAVQKGWDWSVGVGSSLKNWGADLASNFNFAPGLLAASNPMNPAYQAAAADHYDRTANAVAAPGRLLWNGVVDSATIVSDWWRYKIVGAMYGLGSDPVTPSGRARMQFSQQQMEKAPADWEAALALTTFLPIGGASVRVGTTALRSGEIAVAEAAAAAAARRSLPAAVSRTLSDLSAYNPLRNLPDFAKNSFDSMRNLPGFAANGLRNVPGVTSAGAALRNIPGNLMSGLERFRTVPERFQVWRDAKIESLIESVAHLETTARVGIYNTGAVLDRLRFRLGFTSLEPQLATGVRAFSEVDNLLADTLRARFAATHGPGAGFIPRSGGSVSMPNNMLGPVRPRTTQKHTVNFNRGKTVNTRTKIGETVRQVDGQIAGVNKMTANELLHNMKTVSRKGKAQKAANKTYKDAIRDEELLKALQLQRDNPAQLGGKKPARYAEEQMKTRTKDLAALHEQDIVAGGLDVIGLDVTGLPKMGDTFVNSSLGSQWAHRGLADDLRRYAEDLVRAGQGDYLLNVEWILR